VRAVGLDLKLNMEHFLIILGQLENNEFSQSPVIRESCEAVNFHVQSWSYKTHDIHVAVKWSQPRGEKTIISQH